jgi:hypothetical protein
MPAVAMKIVRQIIVGLSVFIGVWVSLSFIGVMFDTGNAGLWTTSLMWALLASVVVMPGLVIAYHASERAETQAERKRARRAMEQQTAFVDDAEQEGPLWSPERAPEDRN